MTLVPTTVACRVCGAKLWEVDDRWRRWAVTRAGHAVWIDELWTPDEAGPATCPDHREPRLGDDSHG